MNRSIILFGTIVLGLLACVLYGAKGQERDHIQWDCAAVTALFISEDANVQVVRFADGQRNIKADSLYDLYQKLGGRKSRNVFSDIDIIRRLGFQGWELTAITTQDIRLPHLNKYYFKRPLR